MNFDEFLQLLLDKRRLKDPEADIRHAFRFFDKDADGYLTVKDLKQVVLRSRPLITLWSLAFWCYLTFICLVFWFIRSPANLCETCRPIVCRPNCLSVCLYAQNWKYKAEIDITWKMTLCQHCTQMIEMKQVEMSQSLRQIDHDNKFYVHCWWMMLMLYIYTGRLTVIKRNDHCRMWQVETEREQQNRWHLSS